jgi:GTP-binding protein HflX
MFCWKKALSNWLNGKTRKSSNLHNVIIIVYIMEVRIPKDLISTLKTPERALLIAVKSNKAGNQWPVEDSVNELAALAYSAGASVAGKVIQKMSRPSITHYLGKGKIEELLAQKEILGYDTVIVDDELTPQQQENIEDLLQTKVIDRIALILDIFAKRARTHEGKLQVELAQYEYNLPRLTGKWRHLERLGAGIGTRGPGESQLETDNPPKNHAVKKTIGGCPAATYSVQAKKAANWHPRCSPGRLYQ